MAREYARIRLSIAEDEDFEDLTPAGQWLYLRVLLPDPSLNYAGVCDWRPKRLICKARGIDLAYILTAAAELEERHYVLFDVATEEALIRTYIRTDELLRNPKMAIAVVAGYQSTTSRVLKAFIVTEVSKAKDEHPEYSSWDHEISKADLSRLLTRKDASSVDYTNQITVPITNRITNIDLGPDYQSDSVQIPLHLTPNNNHLAPSTPPQAQPSPSQALAKQTGAERARERFAALPTRSLDAHRIAEAFSTSLPVPIEAGLLAGIATQIDKCLQRCIPPPAIAAGLKDWTDSDSWSPTQIPNFVHKANNRSRTGKPTEKALSHDDALAELLTEVTTL